MRSTHTSNGAVRGIVLALVRSPSFAVAVVVAMAAALVFGADLGALQQQLAICWAMLAVTHIGLLVTASLVARGATARAPRWVWGGIAAAGLLYAVGDLVQLDLLARGPVDIAIGLGGPVQSALVLVGTVIPLGAVLLLTPVIGHRPRRPRARLALDVAIVMIAATVFGAYLTLPSAGSASLLTWLGVLIGPGLFLSVVLGVVSISRSSNPPMSRLAAGVIVVATTLEAGAQAGAPILTREGRVAWNLGMTVVASALLLVAASVQRARPRTREPRSPAVRRSIVALLPYVALVATFTLLVRVLVIQVSGVQHWAVVVGALISAVLVAVRQVIVIVDNGRLVDELDAKVDELHQLLGERDRLAVALRHEATHDPLTGLGNRALLGTFLDEALARLAARPGRLTLMVIDLDSFKSVNDRFGHAAGDAVLRAVSRRLRGCVRDHDVVARLGGDEFAILVEDLAEDDRELVRRIDAVLRQPITLTEGTVDAAASVGAVTTGDPERTAESLLRAADVAMYEAKRSRRPVVAMEAPADLATGAAP